MNDETAPTHMPIDVSPEVRLRELAAILAAGARRLHQQRLRAGASVDPAHSPPDSLETCLEVHADTVLTVPRAVNGQRDPEIGGAAWN